MTNEEFFFIFEEQIERLDKYFHKRIIRSRIRSEIETLKQELINETAVAVYDKLQEEKYQTYVTHKLIGLKARDIWLEYYEKWVKEANYKRPIEEFSDMPSASDLITILERQSLIESLQKLGSPTSWEMLMMHYDGMPYDEIANHFHVTESSVKMRVSRLRDKLPSSKNRPGL